MQDIKSIDGRSYCRKKISAKKGTIFLTKSTNSKRIETDHLEDILNEILPEAFAVVKETSRRFMENDTLTVSATQHDRDSGSNQGLM